MDEIRYAGRSSWSAASGVSIARSPRGIATTIMVLATGLSGLWSATENRAEPDQALEDCVLALAARLSQPT